MEMVPAEPSTDSTPLLHPAPKGTQTAPPPDRIPATPFAPPYRSVYGLQPPIRSLLPKIAHVNCSYLSTPGVAPTLLQLKQHAQSLCILIKHLTVSTLPGLIDNAAKELYGAPTFSDGETYDFLNDLSTAYEGPVNEILQRHHNMPLTALVNTLEHFHEPPRPGKTTQGSGRTHQPATTDIPCTWVNTRDVCPLHSAPPSALAPNAPSMPYATHQALIAHANEVLELLDHEYSAKGGLLAILPPASAKEDREKAASTLLGQMILHHQTLVARVHDLERLYANAMDIIAGEAATPMQALSALGPDGRAPREMVYPQDRFVLVNAGEDVWSFLHKEFLRKEAVDERVAAHYLASGATGQALWMEQRGGTELARGITAVDITTRYYRLRHSPLQTVFVIPAYGIHPGVQTTRELEQQPTVVACVKPVWPERASMWEMKHRAQLAELQTQRQAASRAAHDLALKTQAETLLRADNQVKDATIANLLAELATFKTYPAKPAQENENENHSVPAAPAPAATITPEPTPKTQLRQKPAATTTTTTTTQQQQQQQQQQQEQQQEQDLKTQHAQWLSHRDAHDREQARDARLLHQRLEAVWRPRMRETYVLLEDLRHVKRDFDPEAVPAQAHVRAGWEAADRVLEGVFRAASVEVASFGEGGKGKRRGRGRGKGKGMRGMEM
jgi:hypothetical protein